MLIRCSCTAFAQSDSSPDHSYQKPALDDSLYANVEQLEQTSAAAPEADTSLLVDLNTDESAAPLDEPPAPSSPPQHEMAARTPSVKSKSSGSFNGGAGASGEPATGDLLQLDSPQHAPAAAAASASASPPAEPSSPARAAANHTQPAGEQQPQQEEAANELRDLSLSGSAALASEFQQGSGQSTNVLTLMLILIILRSARAKSLCTYCAV